MKAKIYTKAGDSGMTKLCNGSQISKGSLRIKALGAIDELNSILGWVRSLSIDKDIDFYLNKIQNDLFTIGTELATPIETPNPNTKRLKPDSQTFLELAIDKLEAQLIPIKKFIIPGGTPAAASLHLARAICRRAECQIVELKSKENINNEISIYLNRLSDFLFVSARYINFKCGLQETFWQEE